MAVELLRSRAALFLIVLVKDLSERHQPSAVHGELRLGGVVEVVNVPVRALGLGGVALGPGAGAVKKEPRQRIEQGGLAGGVIAVNAGALALEVECGGLDALEILKPQGVDFHAASPFRIDS